VNQRVLVAGVGNIFLGDDGFGVEVARRLAKLDLPDEVAVGDYGISGMHLAYDLADGVETAILVDAMPRGGEPGTVYVVEPDRRANGASALDSPNCENPNCENPNCDSPKSDSPKSSDVSSPGVFFDGHGMQPDVVLAMLDTLGADVRRVLIVGCEPASAEPGMELSAPVAAAVDDAVRVVLELIDAAGVRTREETAHVPRHPR
jgi:hydrogenase maturation protease